MFDPGEIVHSRANTCGEVDGPFQRAVPILWTLSGPQNIDVQA